MLAHLKIWDLIDRKQLWDYPFKECENLTVIKTFFARIGQRLHSLFLWHMQTFGDTIKADNSPYRMTTLISYWSVMLQWNDKKWAAIFAQRFSYNNYCISTNVPTFLFQDTRLLNASGNSSLGLVSERKEVLLKLEKWDFSDIEIQ